MHDVDNDEDGSARDCDKVTMRMMAMMMDDVDDEVEDGRGDEMQVNSCASSVTITRRIMRMVLISTSLVEQDSFNSRDKTAAKNHAESHLSSR